MSKIYTRLGDNGLTSLADGKWVAKNSPIIELYGEIDELNSFLGFALEVLHKEAEFIELTKTLYRIQRELFVITRCLTAPEKDLVKEQVDKFTNALETNIDSFSEKLPNLQGFILPGGGEIASRLHLTRSICRRVERVAFATVEKLKFAQIIAAYLNRLSDLLYVAARFVAFKANIEEMIP